MRTASRALIVAALLVSCLCGSASARDFPRWHQLEPLKYSFETFVRDSRRTYAKGSKEYNFRKEVFEARLRDIIRHNADPSQSYKRGINHFADWTAEEWARYNRAHPLERKSTLQENLYIPVAKRTTDLPQTTDYRFRTNPPILTGIKNQGSCGSCWAHSATEELESFFALRYGQLPVLSPQQITSCTTTESGCGGGSAVAAWEAVQQFGGLNEEATYPYTDFFCPNMEQQYTSACLNITKKFVDVPNDAGNGTFLFTWYPKVNVSSYTRVMKNNGLAVMEALATKGPLGITVSSSQWPDYETGILQNNYKNNMTWQSLDHDVQLVGYGFDFDLGLNYWVVRNSWGTNYGEDGFIRLLRPEVEPCGTLSGSEICGTSGVLANPVYPEVVPLNIQNGYYF